MRASNCSVFITHQVAGQVLGRFAGLFSLGSNYFLNYIEGKMWSSLDDPYPCLVPFREGKRKEAMGR